MSVSVAEFWKLTIDSGLFTGERQRELFDEFGQVKGASRLANSRALAEWLISRNALSRYQANRLLSGQPGPFQFGEYTVCDEIRLGSTDVCYRAIHVPTGNGVALHLLGSTVSRDAAMRRELARRAQVLRDLSHQNVCRCYQLVDTGACQFVVTEEPRGDSLWDRVAADGPLSPAGACRAIWQAALGLEALHGAGLVHGATSPGAMYCGPDGIIKLICNPTLRLHPLRNDAEGGHYADSSGLTGFLAPELALPGHVPDVLTDMYALGCSFCFLITGRPPLSNSKQIHGGASHARRSEATIEQLDGVPIGLAEIVTRLMATDRSARVQSASSAAKQLAVQLALADRSRPAAACLATEDSDVTHRIARQKDRAKGWKTFLIAIAAVALVTALVIAAIVKTRPSELTQRAVEPSGSSADRPSISSDGPGIADNTKPASNPSERGIQTAPAHLYDVVDDDGQLLWASPTSGQPFSLNYVPLGAQLILIARPADIMAQPEGARVIQALGPTFGMLRQAWESLTRVALDEIEQVMIVMIPQNEMPPRTTIVARLEQPKELVVSWGDPPSVAIGSKEYYLVKEWAFYVPERESNKVFVMGSIEDVRTVIEADGAAPPLRREMEQLRQWSDADRSLTILLAPSFLNDGRKAFSGSLKPALDPLKWFVGDGIQACSVSIHLGRDFYGEVRMSSTVDTTPGELASLLRERLIAIPNRMDRYLGTIRLQPYWQPLAVKFGQMVQFAHAHARVGIESDQAVLNFVLPSAAAHNLVLAAELSISSAREFNVPTGTGTPTPDLTLEDVLQHRMTLEFPQQSLELAMQNLAGEVNESIPNRAFAFEIQIAGTDLQLDGITRNQQIKDFRLENATIAELLTALVVTANPVTTVKDPSDQDQKLVWVINPDQRGPDRRTVLITTRRAATEKGYDLPGPFRQN